MAQWRKLDLRSDPDVARFEGDPGDLIDPAGFVAELLRRPAWHSQAACRGAGPARWFPSTGKSLEPGRDICAGCAVNADCLADALGRPSSGDSGVWAGTSSRQRRQLRRTAADAA